MAPSKETNDTAHLYALESRIRVLESQISYFGPRFDKVEPKIEDLLQRLARAEERINALPTKELMVMVGLGVVATFIGLITFHDKIAGFIK